MTTAELIEEIETARRSARHLADISEADLRESTRLAEQFSRELTESDRKLREAIKTLRRAGLLK